MIKITARCQTCGWAWKPRKAEGPDLDCARAKKAADAHGRTNRGHTVETKSHQADTIGKRGTIQMIEWEITRR